MSTQRCSPLWRQQAALPLPVAVGGQRGILNGAVVGLVVRVGQAADAAVGMGEKFGGIAQQALTGFAHVGEQHRGARRRTFQTEDQTGHVAGDALQACFALLQCGMGTAPFGDVAEEYQQVFAFAEAQETDRHIHRQQAAVGAHALGFEAQRAFLRLPCPAPQAEPAVHVQAGFEVGQRPVDHRAGRIAEHLFGGRVGIAHAAVPVDPENAHGALVDGELGAPEGLFRRLLLAELQAGIEQAFFQRAALTQQPGEDRRTGQQQRQQHQADVLPQARRLAQARILNPQPAVVQLVELPGRQAAQRRVDQLGQLWLVAAAGHAQEQGKTDIADHRQFAEFLQARQPAELSFIGHRKLAGLVDDLLQGGLFIRAGPQVEVAEVAAQVGQHRAAAGHADRAAGLQRIQLHGAGLAAFADHQMRHAQVRVGVLPQAQAGRSLQQAGGQVDGAGLEGGLQFVLAGIVLPLPTDPQSLAQPLHQLHVGAGQALLAAVELGVG